MRKTRRQLEEDLQQAEQDIAALQSTVLVARVAAHAIYREMVALRKEKEAFLGWYRALRTHLEKDVFPEGLG